MVHIILALLISTPVVATGQVHQASLNTDGFNNGLIFQIDNNNFIVAFEDGDGKQPWGDQDYNDLVLWVHRDFAPIPLPPSALLLGSGLLGLVGFGWRRRKNA